MIHFKADHEGLGGGADHAKRHAGPAPRITGSKPGAAPEAAILMWVAHHGCSRPRAGSSGSGRPRCHLTVLGQHYDENQPRRLRGKDPLERKSSMIASGRNIARARSREVEGQLSCEILDPPWRIAMRSASSACRHAPLPALPMREQARATSGIRCGKCRHRVMKTSGRPLRPHREALPRARASAARALAGILASAGPGCPVPGRGALRLDDGIIGMRPASRRAAGAGSYAGNPPPAAAERAGRPEGLGPSRDVKGMRAGRGPPPCRYPMRRSRSLRAHRGGST